MHKQNNSWLLSSLGTVVVTLGVLMAPSPVWAGFQWVSPDNPEQQMPPVRAAAPAPVSIVGQDYPPTQVIEGTEQAVAPRAATNPSRMQDTLSFTRQSEEDTVVRGFADNIPLSVALRQVLPKEIGFSVAQDVSLGTLVSWKGGASWRQVVKAMLLPAGLTIKEEGQVVQVIHATESQIAAGSSSLPSLPNPPKGESLSSDSRPTPLAPASGSLLSRNLADSSPKSSGYTSGAKGSDLPVSMPVPYVMDKTIGAWTANKGETLQKVLDSWAQRANVELSWQAEYDFPLQASVSLNGSFEEAVRGLLIGFQDARPQPVGFLYNNQMAGQTVLVVQTRGNNYNE